jgi:hypothetical protein
LACCAARFPRRKFRHRTYDALITRSVGRPRRESNTPKLSTTSGRRETLRIRDRRHSVRSNYRYVVAYATKFREILVCDLAEAATFEIDFVPAEMMAELVQVSRSHLHVKLHKVLAALLPEIADEQENRSTLRR